MYAAGLLSKTIKTEHAELSVLSSKYYFHLEQCLKLMNLLSLNIYSFLSSYMYTSTGI